MAVLALACTVPTVAPTPSSGLIAGEIPSAAELTDWPLALAPANEAGMGALLPARLTRAGDCLFLDDGTHRWLAIWPSPGTTWAGSAVTIRGTAVEIGGSAEFGGGETDLSAADVDRLDWIKPPAEECLVAKAWWIYDVGNPATTLTCERVDRAICEAARRVAEADGLFLTEGQEVVHAVVRPTDARLGPTGCDPELDVTFELNGFQGNVVVTVGHMDGIGMGVCTY